MDLGFLYELLNKENIAVFVAGVVVGFVVGSILERSRKHHYETKQRGCAYGYEKEGYITIYLFYKNGKLKNVGCPYKQKRLFGFHCELLDSPCKELV